MATLALIAVTAVWGITFVQVKDAVALYPLFAFLAVRFAIATATLALPAAPRVRTLGRPGLVAGLVLGFFQSYLYAVGNNATAVLWICIFLLAGLMPLRGRAPEHA